MVSSVDRVLSIYRKYQRLKGTPYALEMVNFFSKDVGLREYVKKSLAVEFTVGEVLQGVDGEFIHHDEHLEYLEGVSIPEIVDIVGWSVVWKTQSSGEHSKATRSTFYQQKVKFADMFTMLRRYKDRTKRVSEEELRDAITLALYEGDITVYCECPAARFFYRWVQGQLGIAYGRYDQYALNNAPDITNPERKGDTCKHMDYVLSLIPSEFETKIVDSFYETWKSGKRLYS